MITWKVLSNDHKTINDDDYKVNVQPTKHEKG